MQKKCFSRSIRFSPKLGTSKYQVNLVATLTNDMYKFGEQLNVVFLTVNDFQLCKCFINYR